MAPGDEIGQVKPVACTVSHCQMRFDTGKEMKIHKKAEPDHFYCKKCDVDCADWEALTLHKVMAMQPWLEGHMLDYPEISPKHIVCEFCGQDFKSFGGRKLHRQNNHRASQNITCPGCKIVFPSGSSIVSHLEMGECSAISSDRYMAYIQHKLVNKQIMVNHDVVQLQLQANMESKMQALKLESGSAESASTSVAGTDDHDQQRAAERSWPFLPGQEPVAPHKSVIPSGVKSPTSSTKTPSPSDSLFPDISASPESCAGGIQLPMSPIAPSQSALGKERATPDLDTITNTSTATPAWTSGSASQSLFPDAKSTTSTDPINWKALLYERQERHLASLPSSKDNMLTMRIFDPTSADYDASRFYNYDTNRYCCPLSSCADYATTYESAHDLAAHFEYAHLRISWTCPTCFKRFKSGRALFSHAESNGKCNVKESAKYRAMLDEMSGGFLKVEYLREPRIATGEQLGQDGGLMSERLWAKMPEQESSGVRW